MLNDIKNIAYLYLYRRDILNIASGNNDMKIYYELYNVYIGRWQQLSTQYIFLVLQATLQIILLSLQI